MAVIDHPQIAVAKPGWYPDPHHQHNLRYHDGETWTDHVTHYGPTPCLGCGYGDSSIFNN
ncbi:MAG: DUF2510 domain-containing protein [Acidimicrobiales bacterium]